MIWKEQHENQQADEPGSDSEPGAEQSRADTEADEVLLVKMKSLSWPAIVQKREGDIIEVKMQTPRTQGLRQLLPRLLNC